MPYAVCLWTKVDRASWEAAVGNSSVTTHLPTPPPQTPSPQQFGLIAQFGQLNELLTDVGINPNGEKILAKSQELSGFFCKGLVSKYFRKLLKDIRCFSTAQWLGMAVLKSNFIYKMGGRPGLAHRPKFANPPPNMP